MEVLALAPGWKVPILPIYIIWMNGGGTEENSILTKLIQKRTFPYQDVSLETQGGSYIIYCPSSFAKKTKHTYCDQPDL